MQNIKLNGIEFHRALENGYRNLKKNVEIINNLNVFPVPDGDTGTNMVKTFGGGIKLLQDDIIDIGEYMKKLSNAVLLSARGNSGVIFSQFINGIYRAFEKRKEIEFCDFTNAFVLGKEDAYASILTPTEGTILTVIREAAEFLEQKGQEYKDFCSGIAALLSQMRLSLSKTPEMLPILKEAGVVDSGGAGLVCIFEGMYAYFCGESVEDTPEILDTISEPIVVNSNFGPDSRLEYGYCTEFILQLMNYKIDIASFDLKEFTKHLEELGDSIVSVYNEGIVKIHIHTFTPELVLGYARQFGELVTIKIENMSVQHSSTGEIPQKKSEHLKYAIVSVASGEGIIDYFYEIGSNAVIDGGQTNNPSVEALLKVFGELDAENIIVLPNNSNIILTAKQAAEIYKNCKVHIIPTKSIVEGYSALSMMNPWSETPEELIEDMSSGLDNIVSASVTTATRDTVMNSLEIKKGSYIGLSGKEILCCNEQKVATAKELIKQINDIREREVIIVFCGKGVTDSEKDELEAFLTNEYPLCEIGFIDGKQEVYDFIISLE